MQSNIRSSPTLKPSCETESENILPDFIRQCIAATADPPSESDEDGDTLALGYGRVWAYPCKLLACPEYGKTWVRQSNFLNHLKDHQVHRDSDATKTRQGRRSQALAWRYETSMHDPPRTAPDFQPAEPKWDYSYRTRDGILVRTFKHFDFQEGASFVAYANSWITATWPWDDDRGRGSVEAGLSLIIRTWARQSWRRGPKRPNHSARSVFDAIRRIEKRPFGKLAHNTPRLLNI